MIFPAPQMGPHAARTADAEPRTFPNGRTRYRWEGAWGREGEVVLTDARCTTVPQGVDMGRGLSFPHPGPACRAGPTGAKGNLAPRSTPREVHT